VAIYIEPQPIKKNATINQLEIKSFPPLFLLPWMVGMELICQLLRIPLAFHWFPTHMHIAVSSSFNKIMKLTIAPFEVRIEINFPLLQVIDQCWSFI